MNIIRNKNFWIIFAADIVLLLLCYYSAFWLRFDGDFNAIVNHAFLTTIVPLIFIKLGCFLFFDLYRGMWRYTGIMDLINVLKASVTSFLLFVLYLAMFHHFMGISRAVVLADSVFTIVAIGGSRLFIRIYYQRKEEIWEDLHLWKSHLNKKDKVLILGTGPLAERLLREINNTETIEYDVIGFIEERKKNKGMKIHGVPILGLIEDLPFLVDYYGINTILIATQERQMADINAVIESCSGLGVHYKVVPSLIDRLNGTVADKLRDIRVEDLLDRKEVVLDEEIVEREIKGKRVLITGAGGSIGSELARQVSELHPDKLILFDNSETPLYNIDMELKSKPHSASIIPVIGDIRSYKSLERVFRKYKPQVIYHAAAYKHVPMMEHNPIDAINNNIIGSYKLASISCRYEVEKFVLISTDKAVHPTSVMGATKRVAEMIVSSLNGNGTRFITVRFGNVLGSNGSVVPLFENQIASGGPVTVTHPDVTRFFMSIQEAVMLVLQASAIGGGGELFILEMGDQIKIIDLAKNMVRLAGLIPDKDVPIKIIGLRPGEKLHEELLIDGEDIVDTAYDKIKICKNSHAVDEKILYECIERFRLLIKDTGDPVVALSILKTLVPTFSNKLNSLQSPRDVKSAVGMDVLSDKLKNKYCYNN